MTNSSAAITSSNCLVPPPELVQQWVDMLSHRSDQEVFTTAAQWGADQELEACCEWATQFNYDDYRYQDELRVERRLELLSMKQQAVKALECLQQRTTDPNIIEPIRRALEQLND